MKFVSTALVFALWVCFAIGHILFPGPSDQTALRNSRSVFVDCCLGRKLLCKRPPVPWVTNRQSRPKLLQPSLVCDGTKDCPLGEDEVCIKCEVPPQVQSGYRVDGLTFFPVGTVSTYACLPGFVMRDVTHVTCDNRGLWSKAPVCDKLCDGLPSVENGTVRAGEPHTPGDTVIVSCNDGFLPLGNNFFKCADNGSWIGTPACVRLCDGLPSVASGTVRAGEPHTPGDTVIVSCNDGFVPLGNNFLKCASNGSWIGTPACVRLCDGLPSVASGTVRVGEPHTPGDTVIVSCNDGFVPLGNNFLKCASNGSWIGTPACVRLCDGLPSVASGTVRAGEPHTPGDTVIVSCNDGFEPLGNNFLKCASNGSWIGTPACVRLCDGLPSVASGTVRVGEPHTPGDTVIVSCNDGFVPLGNNFLKCASNGSWIGTPACVRLCDGLPSVANGTVSAGEPLTPGDTVLVSCNDDFVPLVNNFFKCADNGSWIGTPACVRLCDGLLSVANGTVSAGKPLTPEDTVIVSCNDGFLPLGNNFLKCASNGSWIGTPACVRLCDGLPSVENGTVSAGEPLTPGDTVIVSCNDGFLPLGNNFFKCTDNGSWIGTPACVRLCDGLPSVGNGSVSADKPLTPGDIVELSCYDDFRPLGNGFLKCAANGSWIGTPACVRLSCPVVKLPAIVNATRSVTGPRTVGSRVTYTCNDGFSPLPFNNMNYTCKETGEWTGNASCSPSCTNVVSTSNGTRWRLCNGNGPGFSHHPNKGRIEVNFFSEWGTLCDDSDDKFEAEPWTVGSLNVACRTLGFSGSNGVNRRSAFFGKGKGPILMDNVACLGSETLLTDCPHSRNHTATGSCSHAEDQGIECI